MYLVLELCHNGEFYRYLKSNARVFTEDEGELMVFFFTRKKITCAARGR